MGFILSDLITKAMGGYAKKPKVPNAPNVSGQDSQIQASKGNLAALPGLEDLANQTNEFNVGQYQKRMGQLIPGYQGIMGGASDNLTNWLNGVLSPDVASQVRRNANVRAFGGGYAGSGMGDNLQARDLGLTSLDLQQKGLSSLPGFIGASQLGAPAQYNPANDFLSTQEQIGLNQWNENSRYSRDWLQNQLNAIPDPATAAIARDTGTLVNPAGMVGGILGDVYGGSQGAPSLNFGGTQKPNFGGSGGGGGGDMANDFIDATNVGETAQASGGGY